MSRPLTASSSVLTDAQKFKAKFDECKEEVRKQKGDTGEWKDPQFVPSFFPFFDI